MKEKARWELFIPIHLKKCKSKTERSLLTQKYIYGIEEPGTEHETGLLIPNSMIFPLDHDSSKPSFQYVDQTN